MRTAVLASAVYVVAVAVVLGDVLVQGNARLLSAEGQDLIGIFLHWHEFAFRELRAGHLPLWNPHVYAGAPFFAAFQPGLLYPPSWIGLVLPSIAAINVGIALHFCLGGLWTHLWAARRGLHPAASILAGLVFMWCGPHFLQLWRGHLPTLRTIVWSPLVFLSIDGAAAGRTRPWILVGIAAGTLQLLAGLVQQFYYTAIVAAVYAVVTHGRTAGVARVSAAVIAMYAGATVLAAVQILPGLDAGYESLRGALAYELARTFAFPPENVLTLVVPGVFGSMIDDPYWGRWTLTEASLFVGVAVFVLAVYGAVSGARERRRGAVVLFVVTLILSFGYYTPLFRLLYDWLPLFASFRGTSKFVFLAALFVALLAGVGLDAVLRSRAARWPVAVAAGCAVLLLGGAVAITRSAAAGDAGAWARLLASIDLHDEAFSYYATPRTAAFTADAATATARSLTIGGTTFALVAVCWWAARRHRGAAWAIAAIACIELLAYARYTRATCDPAAEEREVASLRALMTREPARGSDFRVLSMIDPYRAMSAGAFDIWGYDPMLLTRYADFLAFSQGMQPHDLVVRSLERLTPMLGFLRLRYVLQSDAAHAEASDLPELPLAFVAHDWRVVPDLPTRLRTMAAATFDPRRTALLERPMDATPGADAATGSGDVVTAVHHDSDTMDITVETAVPAMLLVTDNYARGWTATSLDDHPPQARYDVVPADVTFRGVPLAPGRHHLRLAYRPRAFTVGTAISVVGLALYLAVVAVEFRWLWREPYPA